MARVLLSVDEAKSGRFRGYNQYNEIYSKNNKLWEIVDGIENGIKYERVEQYIGRLEDLNFGYCPYTGNPIPLKILTGN